MSVVVGVFSLRWYGEPGNIYNDERILKYDYNQGFKISKSITFAPKCITKTYKRDKKSYNRGVPFPLKEGYISFEG